VQAAPTSQANILIVDDVPTNLHVLAQTLRTAGFMVWLATDGHNALGQIAHEQPDLILLDVRMPDIDGFEVCKRLQANPKTCEIPIIFMTAHQDAVDKVKGLSLGGVDYVTKPFQDEEVLARIKVHLRLRALREALQQEIEQRKQTEAQLAQANDRLRRLANLDALTQVANRYRFDDYLNQTWKRLQREQLPLSLVLCDVDYFKNFNDRYGHQVGDDCLRQVAQAIEQGTRRPADLVARYGGEEFAVILPTTTLEGAQRLCANMRTHIQQLQIPHATSQVSSVVTVSFGLVNAVPTAEITPQLLIQAADKALYRAKSQGRDTAVSWHLADYLAWRQEQ
jgi:diguanylate cyclase (GGDEF)-like protein